MFNLQIILCCYTLLCSLNATDFILQTNLSFIRVKTAGSLFSYRKQQQNNLRAQQKSNVYSTRQQKIICKFENRNKTIFMDNFFFWDEI